MSFEQLIGLRKTAIQFRQEDDAEPVVDCPICGHRLNSNGRELDCPFGHYRTREGTTQGEV